MGVTLKVYKDNNNNGATSSASGITGYSSANWMQAFGRCDTNFVSCSVHRTASQTNAAAVATTTRSSSPVTLQIGANFGNGTGVNGYGDSFPILAAYVFSGYMSDSDRDANIAALAAWLITYLAITTA